MDMHVDKIKIKENRILTNLNRIESMAAINTNFLVDDVQDFFLSLVCGNIINLTCTVNLIRT